MAKKQRKYWWALWWPNRKRWVSCSLGSKLPLLFETKKDAKYSNRTVFGAQVVKVRLEEVE